MRFALPWIAALLGLAAAAIEVVPSAEAGDAILAGVSEGW